MNMNQYIRSVSLRRDKINNLNRYPFNIPVLQHFDNLNLDEKVTFFIGENGTGKSTLLEAIAVSCGFNPEGGSKNFCFSTYDTHSSLSDFLLLVKGAKQPEDGYFLRAESFYNVASEIEHLDQIPAAAPPITQSYGGSLHSRSHGESFFALLQNRLGGHGLYLFDEPEAALSPFRQLAMLTRINELVQSGSQFIIATHSPIILAYPDSTIYHFSADGIKQFEYEQTENYQITREFLLNYKSMLKELFK